MSCKDDSPPPPASPEALKPSNQIFSLAFQDSIGAINTISLDWEKGQSPFVDKKVFPNGTPAKLEVKSKSGYAFSVPLIRENKIPPSDFEAPKKILAISDIEGNFDPFISFLMGTGVVDENLNWSFGKNHLVLVGDFFDRGEEVFNCLWLIYKLDQEAQTAGGAVHFVLGNHEQMNLRNDLRYVHKKYKVLSNRIQIPYNEWLVNGSILGDWLRTKNCILKIGDNLFCHGGLSPEFVENGWSILEANDKYRKALSSSWEFIKPEAQKISGRNGPLWYRGMSLQELKEEEVKSILENYNTKRVVVGHTIIDGEKISSLYQGQVINIDLHHKDSFKKGIVKGLLITSNGLFEIDNRNHLRKLK